MPNQPLLSDWIRETSSSTGTGDITLLGAVASFRTFASMFAVGDTFYYTTKHRTALEAESGIGQLTASGTIARNTILESTNANAAVAFSAGTKDVFIAPVSKMFPTLATNEIWQGVTGSVPIATSSPTFGNVTVSNLQASGLITTNLGLTVNGQIYIVSQATAAIPLVIQGIAGQTGNLTEWRDSTNAVRLFVQPSGEIRGNVGANASVVLQEGTGIGIINAGIATQWADSIASSIRIRLGDTAPSTTNNVVFCAANNAQFARLAILSNVVQVARNTATTSILAPIANAVFEVQGNSVGNILVGLRARASQTANLLATYDSTDTAMSAIGPAGTFRAPDGIVTAPGFGFLGSVNTGIYRSGTTISFAIAGGGPYVSISSASPNVLISPTANTRALDIKGVAGQTLNLTQWMDSASTVLASVLSDGKFRGADGDTALPGIAFQLDLDTGIYRGGTNIIGLSTAGAARLEIIASGSVILAKGGALATNATGGFVYLPTCPGNPTGVPVTQTGTIPMVADSTNSANFIYSGGEWICIGPTTVTHVFYLSGAMTVGTNKGAEITMPFAGKILRARARAKTAPTGADLIFDVNLNGTTIWSTQANRLKIIAGATTGTQSTFNTTTFADGDVLTVDVDQIGSSTAGSDITLQLEVRKIG